MTELPKIEDAIAAAKAKAPTDRDRFLTYGLDEDGTLIEADMRRTAIGKWIVVRRPKKISG